MAVDVGIALAAERAAHFIDGAALGGELIGALDDPFFRWPAASRFLCGGEMIEIKVGRR